jgi:hypothetical protein
MVASHGQDGGNVDRIEQAVAHLRRAESVESAGSCRNVQETGILVRWTLPSTAKSSRAAQ